MLSTNVSVFTMAIGPIYRLFWKVPHTLIVYFDRMLSTNVSVFTKAIAEERYNNN